MGHGASSPKAALNPLFVNYELVQGSKFLADDEKFRASFINYIKSGLWIEKLAKLVREDKFKAEITMLAHAQDDSSSSLSLKEYQSSKTIHELEYSTKDWSSSKRTSSTAMSPKSSLKSPSHRTESFSESYVNIEDFRCFDSLQLIAILANVLYPLFITHSEIDLSSQSQSGVESMSSELMDAVGLRRPKRVQEVFLGMAAYFDESALHNELQTGAWVGRLPETFDHYQLCITISDTSQEGCPVVYANKAFLALTGYTATQLLGNNFDIFNGPKTEESQIKLLDEAVKFQRAAKIVITHYTAGSKREFSNFIALKPSGKYVIGVHFVPTRANRVEDLQLVDDLLMILTYVVKYPRPNRGEIRRDLPLPRGISYNSELFLKEMHRPSSANRPPRGSQTSQASHPSQVIHQLRMDSDDAEERVSVRSFALSPLEVSELSRPMSEIGSDNGSPDQKKY